MIEKEKISISNDRDLNEEILEVVHFSPQERIDFISDWTWVLYPRAHEYIIELKRALRQKKSVRMRGLMLIGETNIGKTSLIQEFIDQNTDLSDKSHEWDFLYVEAPENPSIKALYIEILSACRVTAIWGTTEQLKQRVITCLRELDVRMLFIDEIHNLLTAQSNRVLVQCRNAFKGLSNRLQIPIVLIGTKEAKQVISGDPQVRNRYPVFELLPFENDDDFETLLYTLESRLPLHKASYLYINPLRDTVFELSRGLLGNASIIIKESAIEAIERGSEHINLNIIEDLKKKGVFQF